MQTYVLLVGCIRMTLRFRSHVRPLIPYSPRLIPSGVTRFKFRMSPKTQLPVVGSSPYQSTRRSSKRSFVAHRQKKDYEVNTKKRTAGKNNGSWGQVSVPFEVQCQSSMK